MRFRAPAVRLWMALRLSARQLVLLLVLPWAALSAQQAPSSTQAAGSVNPLSCNPATLCGPGAPPVIQVVPNLWGITQTDSTLHVAIYWCDDGGLNAASRADSLNHVSVTTTYGWYTHSASCWEGDTSSVTLHFGKFESAESFTASITDNFGQRAYYWANFTYDPRKLTVSPKGDAVNAFSSQTMAQSFSITNYESSPQTYLLTASCTSGVTSCTADSTRVTIPSGTQGAAMVHYHAPAYGGSGTLTLVVQDTGTTHSYDVDTAWVAVTSGRATAMTFAANTNDTQRRGWCATACFAAMYDHGTVPYVSLGSPRSVTLHYDEGRVAVRPTVSADVTLAAGAPSPTELTLQATLKGTAITFLNGETTLHFTSTATTLVPGRSDPIRLAGQFDASADSTGVYPLTITATAVYGDHTEVTTDTTKLLLVNLRTPDLLPVAGWTIQGVQHLLPQADSTVVIVEGDASGVAFGCKAYAYPCAGPAGDFSTLQSSGSGGTLTYTRRYPDSTVVTFSNVGRMTAVRDRWGNTTTFTYTGPGQLASIKDPLVSGDTAVTTFVYNSGSFTIEPPGPRGIGQSTTRALVVAYDGNARVTRLTDPDGKADTLKYDASGRLSSLTDRRGGVTSYTYDATSWFLTKVTLPQVPIDAGTGGSTTMASPVVRYTAWQTVGVPTGPTSPTKAAPAFTDTLYATVTDPDSVATRYTADRWGQPLTTIDALADTARIARTGPFATVTTDPQGQVDSAQYTGAFLTWSHPHDQPATSYTYDAWGQVASVSGGGGPPETLSYDATHHWTIARVSGGYPDTTFFDARGRDTAQVDPAGHRTKVFYEATFGNADSTVKADSQWTRAVMNAWGLDSVAQAEGQPKALVLYDVLNRVTAAYDTVGASPTTLRYDALYQTALTDPKGQLYKTDVNALGWPTTSYDPKDTVGTYTAAQYDAAGQVKHARNRRGQWIAYQYDALGRVISRRDPLAPADSFQYLDHGRVVIAKNSIETDTLKAGKAGADTTSTVVAAGPLFRRVWTKTEGVLGDTLTDSSSATALTFLKQRRYWSATTGALDSIVVGTSKVRFTVDAELLPDSTIYPNYTVLRLHTTTHQDYSTFYGTNLLDSVFTRTYAFDSLGRMTSEGHINGYQNGWTWDLRNFAYNASGPLRWYQRATTTNRTCEPDYGCRLASTVPYQTYGYPHYDAALNLLTRVDSTHGNAKDSATFAVGDRVTSWLGASYTYDADGNRATRTIGSTVTTYTWDAVGRLLQVKTGSDSVTYAYNALGDLARRSTKGRVDRWFVWEAGQLLEELDSTAQHRVNAFAYLPGTDAALARITGDAAGTIEFVQQDGRGDVIGLTNGASVTQHVLYGPWGDVEGFSGDSLPQTRLGWKGLVWEGGTAQLYYVRSRWYDPQSRSFLSEDPLGLSGGRNTYAYGDNDPINGWDPSGLSQKINCPEGQVDIGGFETDDGGLYLLCLDPGGGTITAIPVAPQALPAVTVTAGSNSHSANAPTQAQPPELFRPPSTNPFPGTWSPGHTGGSGDATNAPCCTATQFNMFVSQVGLQLQPISNKAFESYAHCAVTGSSESVVQGAAVGAMARGVTKDVLKDAGKTAGDTFIANAIACPLGGVGIDDAVDYYWRRWHP